MGHTVLKRLGDLMTLIEVRDGRNEGWGPGQSNLKPDQIKKKLVPLIFRPHPLGEPHYSR